MLFTISDVSLRRGSAVLLDRVSAEIPEGACTGVVGRSGAGKSTLLRLLTRLDDPDSGEIAFHGTPLLEYDVLDVRRRVQLVAQQPVLVTDRVPDEIRVGRPDLDPSGVASVLSRVGLPASFADRATAGLSGGEAQRVCLARALAMEPEVVLMDEPTSALDMESAEAIESAVKDMVARGGAVVLVSHNVAQIGRVADGVMRLDQGRVVS